MRTFQKSETILSIAMVVFGVLLLASAVIYKPQIADATGPLQTNIGYTATSSARISVTASARVAATTTNPLVSGIGNHTRLWTAICNPNANPVYLRLDGDKPTDASAGSYTYVIAAAAGYNACFEIDDRNQYHGSITASSTNQTATVISVTQYVQ